MSRAVFAMLDESFMVPQHIQMLMFKHYADVNDLRIEFYGSEIRVDHAKRLFTYYLQQNRSDTYLFFSIKQFVNKTTGYMEWNILEEAMARNIVIHFANENLKLCSSEHINNIKMLMLSQK